MRNAREEKAFKGVIAFVRNQQEQGIGVSGYTFSAPDTFYGYWWDGESGRWVEDKIILLMIDYQIPLGDPGARSLSEQISDLKQRIAAAYKRYGCKQDEVWVVSNPISRYQ